MFITDALTRESLAVEDTGVIQIGFRAVKIGDEHAEIRFIPADTLASDQLSISLETHVEMSQDDFRTQLEEASKYADNSYHAANLYMANAGPPYREAWEHVKKTFEKAGERSTFNEIVLDLVLRFLAGTAGGKISEFIKEKKAGEPIAEGLKELGMHAIDAGVQAVLPKESAALPQDPADWADAAHYQIEAELLAVGTISEDLMKANEHNTAGFFRDFDVVDVVHNACKFNGQPMRSLATATIPPAEDFEKAIWKGWLEAYGATGCGPGITDHAWVVISHRIADIGEDPIEFIRTHVGEGFDQSMKERSGK
jgi:hypothetical protein